MTRNLFFAILKNILTLKGNLKYKNCPDKVLDLRYIFKRYCNPKLQILRHTGILCDCIAQPLWEAMHFHCPGQNDLGEFFALSVWDLKLTSRDAGGSAALLFSSALWAVAVKTVLAQKTNTGVLWPRLLSFSMRLSHKTAEWNWRLSQISQKHCFLPGSRICPHTSNKAVKKEKSMCAHKPASSLPLTTQLSCSEGHGNQRRVPVMTFSIRRSRTYAASACWPSEQFSQRVQYLKEDSGLYFYTRSSGLV